MAILDLTETAGGFVNFPESGGGFVNVPEAGGGFVTIAPESGGGFVNFPESGIDAAACAEVAAIPINELDAELYPQFDACYAQFGETLQPTGTASDPYADSAEAMKWFDFFNRSALDWGKWYKGEPMPGAAAGGAFYPGQTARRDYTLLIAGGIGVAALVAIVAMGRKGKAKR